MNPLLTHFGLTCPPFARNTPKGALLRHRGFEEAKKRLLFTVELESIAVLLSGPGCGKSLLLGEIADELKREGVQVHYLAHTTLGPFGLVNVLARKTGLAPRRSRGETALAGQNSLDDRLAEPIHHALDQRITTFARLRPLSVEETGQYVETRLKAAGADRPVFEDGAVDLLFDAAGGVPRAINNLATAALIVAAARNRRLVGAQDVKDAQMDRGRP